MFSFLHADREHNGAWSWPTDGEAGEILRFLCEVSQYTWSDVLTLRQNGRLIHHEQAVDSVCLEAQDRITELGHDLRIELLFRFFLGNRKRLWGWVTEGIFYVLWWDADHKVYPVEEW